MKMLVVYYSRTGCTKKIAQALAGKLGADIEEIREVKGRNGAMGYLTAGKDAAFKKPSDIKPTSKDPTKYDLVLIGTPVWSFTVASPLRMYLSQHNWEGRQVGYFVTQTASGDDRTFNELEDLTGRRPVAVMTILEKDVAADQFAASIDSFVKQLNNVFAATR